MSGRGEFLGSGCLDLGPSGRIKGNSGINYGGIEEEIEGGLLHKSNEKFPHVLRTQTISGMRGTWMSSTPTPGFSSGSSRQEKGQTRRKEDGSEGRREGERARAVVIYRSCVCAGGGSAAKKGWEK